ncbi:MAG: hypothetical protein QG641_936 [Candidatus Poribacteria bacterium]|nr:hypothetical protein [Candidatus Poribacteria bacterium]
MKDKRPNTEITPQIIFLSVLICCLLRFGSLNRLEFELKNKRLSKFLKPNKCDKNTHKNIVKNTFCANTIANGLENTDVSILEHQLVSIPKKMKRNKVYCKSIGGLKIASVDGTEIYRSEKIQCDECLEYHINTKEGIRIDYVHKIVLMQMVGKIDLSYIQTILGMEKILPKDIIGDTSEEGHEGETTSAKRLILKMIERVKFSLMY